MSSQQKRGFRLPWGPERASDADAVATAPLDAATSEPTSGVVSDDLDDGPMALADASPPPTTDEAPASPDVPVATAEAMMETSEQTESTENEATQAEATSNVDEAAPGAWPDVDRRSGSRRSDDKNGPIIVVRDVPYEAPLRREKPLVAGLVKAMREAAVSSRDETLSRLRAEAGARVEGIRSRATEEAAELRKRADGDIAEIRDWSKAEVARVRQETEDRIEARKADLTGETERHAENVERLVSDVQGIVERFKTDMDGFFDRLLAEDDPSRLASLAEQAPDAPDLSGDGPAAIDMINAAGFATSQPDGLEADDAAAAEVAATEGLDMAQGSDWPAAAIAAARGDAAETADVPITDGAATRLLISGLGSVAGISALKGALGQLPGVHNVSVSSGERGEFVFAITHDPGLDLASGITNLPGFSARITDATDDGITVVAHEPAA